MSDWDPLTGPIPEDKTRLGDDALTLHELAAAEQRTKRGTVYSGKPRAWRRIVRAARRVWRYYSEPGQDGG